MSTRYQLKCAETWAGNGSTSKVAELPGLRLWVYSRAYGASNAGGDVHYVSVCPDCTVSRVALADVSGHGRAVEAIGARLRELMEKHLAALSQANLMRDLNEAVRRELEGMHYATLVAVGFHARRGLCVMTNAGHPPALRYRNERAAWEWSEPRRADGEPTVTGTPLGLLPNVSYRPAIVTLRPGDLIVLYSDGISDARNADGEELGRARLMTLARKMRRESAETFGHQLLEAIEDFRRQQAPEDDETIIVLEPFPRQSP